MLELDVAATIRRNRNDSDRCELRANCGPRRRGARRGGGLGGAFDRLAHGDLKIRLTDAFPPRYEKLRGDFNGSVEQLESAIGRVIVVADSLRAGCENIAGVSDRLSQRTESEPAR